MKTRARQTINTDEVRRQMKTNGSSAYALERKIDRSANKRVEERILREHTVRKNMEVKRIHIPSIMFTVVSLAFLCFMIFSYLDMRSDIVSLTSNTSTLESSIEKLTADNNQMYASIMASVDLDTIKDVAINELGMVYAQKDQIISYAASVDDYVQQYGVIE